MECPKCGMANPPSASSCDCGYVFTSGEVSPELERKRRIDARRRRRGTWSLALGISSLLLLGVAQFVLHLRGFSVISPSSHSCRLNSLAAVVRGSDASGEPCVSLLGKRSPGLCRRSLVRCWTHLLESYGSAYVAGNVRGNIPRQVRLLIFSASRLVSWVVASRISTGETRELTFSGFLRRRCTANWRWEPSGRHSRESQD